MWATEIRPEPKSCESIRISLVVGASGWILKCTREISKQVKKKHPTIKI
jgi:hypothetical protein